VSLPVHLSPEASADLGAAAHWYERQHVGLGLAFLSAVDLAINSLGEWPRLGSIVEGLPDDLKVRRVAVSRFPYHLAYLVSSDRALVIAVAHDRRRPNYWRSRTET
jgi:plasmid stabilization system protein ParE